MPKSPFQNEVLVLLFYSKINNIFIIYTRGFILEKIAIIDLGSNTARLVIVEILGDGHFIVTDQIKESVRLGKDMERDGFLKPQRIAETLKTLKMFRRL